MIGLFGLYYFNMYFLSILFQDPWILATADVYNLQLCLWSLLDKCLVCKLQLVWLYETRATRKLLPYSQHRNSWSQKFLPITLKCNHSNYDSDTSLHQTNHITQLPDRKSKLNHLWQTEKYDTDYYMIASTLPNCSFGACLILTLHRKCWLATWVVVLDSARQER